MANIPPYVESLQHDLETSHSTERVLLKYAYCITRDVTLAEVYRALGFNAEKNCFAGVVDKDRVVEMLGQEYGVVSHSNVESLLAASVTATPTKVIEYDEELRNSFLRTYTDTKLSRIARSGEIGIEGYSDNKENEFFTPLHKRHLFSTPRPNRTYHSVSTRASRLITPSSITSVSDDESDFDPVKSSRGLKSLTIQVKQILATHRNISYQEVASILTKEAVSGSGNERIREEKNIKRRVYDAINVLIAAGVLDKDEKGVFMKSSTEKFDSSDLEEEVLTLRENVRQKRAQLTELLNRFLAVQNLIHRNAQNKDAGEILPFPFLVLGAEDAPDNAV